MTDRAATPLTRPKIKAMRIATRCTTIDEFIVGFQPYYDTVSLFIPTLAMRPIGHETAFAIQLADGTALLRGLGVIEEAWETDANPFKRPGLRVKFVRLTPDSNELLAVMRKARHAPRTDEFETPTSVENTAPPVPRPVEVRTPGGVDVLPANPLTAMSDESLGAFVDCMLYEETQDTVAEPDQWGDVTSPDAPLVPRLAINASPNATAMEQIQAAHEHHARAPIGFLAPMNAPCADPPPADLGRRRRRPGLLAGIAVATLAIAALVWLVAIRGSALTPALPLSIAPAPAPVAVVVPVVPVAPVVPVVPGVSLAGEARGVPSVPTPTPARPREEPDLPVVGSGPCRISVTSTPAGAIVAVDDATVGPTPITIDGPCHARKLELGHPRYAKLVHVVTPTASEPIAIDLAMQRPTHTLRLASTPGGATVSINGRRAGTTPTAISVMGFSSVTLTVDKPGYKSIAKRVYSTQSDETMAFSLVRK